MCANKKTLVFGGYSKVPEDTSMFGAYKSFGIGVEVEPDTMDIIDASSTFITDFSQRFLASILVGKNMRNGGIKDAIMEIDTRYFCRGKKTIIATLLEVEKNYLHYCDSHVILD